MSESGDAMAVYLVTPKAAAVLPAIVEGVLRLIDTESGELLNLPEATPRHLALAIEWLNDVGRRALELRAHYEDEVRRRMDLDRAWTLRDGGVQLEAPSDAPVDVWDKTLLRATLTRLVALGKISEAGAKACWLTPKPPDPDVSKRGVEALLKHPESDVRDAVAACRASLPRTTRPVKVNIKEAPRGRT